MAHNLSKKKKEFLESFRTVPIVTLCCEKVGVPRATFYRWKKEDTAFAQLAEEALGPGKESINDLCKSKLIQDIHERKKYAITFWLVNNDKDFMRPEKIRAIEPEGVNTFVDLVLLAEKRKREM